MESKEKPTMSLRLTPTTKERLTQIIDGFKDEADKRNDQQEEAVKRIIQILENSNTQMNHPRLEPSLKAVEKTIGTLVKQINGIVAEQDTQIADLQKQLDAAVTEKNEALEGARIATEAAKVKQQAADAAIAQAAAEIEQIKEQAQEQIEATKQAADAQTKVAETEKRQALQECEDARTIAAEKTASNDLLLKQMQSMEEEAAAYKALKKEHQDLIEQVHQMEQKQVQRAASAALELERAIIAKEREYMAQIASLEAEIKQLEKNGRK